ncbi:hypothetical protein [Sediminivirga luteola]|uniref:HTH cro/C1-type domain-containing protein n=1 Tax=Sediminivirga luteola TaxID=1774748 RepID=A0A8J2XK28_9MICO|nr:hypothetical protein [Sediminivirga luteola]GGA11103.1 hypothetical protein GCM10011333_12430 [Sediminivirga luteola]
MSRLSDVLNELSRTKRMNQPQIVQRSSELGVPLSKGNVSRYLSGKHPEKPQQATLAAFAKVFGVPVDQLEEAARHTGREPFEPHRSADLLTAPQRAAVNEIIRLLAEGNVKAGDGSDSRSATSMNQSGPRPAPVLEEDHTAPPTPDEEILRYAADRGPSEGKSGWGRGEESQDPNDWDKTEGEG